MSIISLQDFEKHSFLEKPGLIRDIDNSTTPCDVYLYGKETPDYPFPSSEERLKLVSTSNEDRPGGTGMFRCRVVGLDHNLDIISEEVTLNGTSEVLTEKKFYRVYRVSGDLTSGTSNVGSHGVNVGEVQCRNEISDDVLSGIWPDHGQSKLGNSTMPNDKRFKIFLVTDWGGSIYGSGSRGARLIFQCRRPGGSWVDLDETTIVTTGTSSNQGARQFPLRFKSGMDVRTR